MIYIARKKICNFEFMYIIEQCNTGLFFFFIFEGKNYFQKYSYEVNFLIFRFEQDNSNIRMVLKKASFVSRLNNVLSLKVKGANKFEMFIFG